MLNKVKKGEYYLYYPNWPDKHWNAIFKLIKYKSQLKLKLLYEKENNKLVLRKISLKSSIEIAPFIYNNLRKRKRYQRIKKNKLQELLVKELI